MRKVSFLLAAAAILAFGLTPLSAADKAPAKVGNKRLLLVTDSGGFIHDSVGVAEQVLKEIGPKNGFDVTCWRFTREPDPKVLAKYSEEFRKRTGLLRRCPRTAGASTRRRSRTSTRSCSSRPAIHSQRRNWPTCRPG